MNEYRIALTPAQESQLGWLVAQPGYHRWVVDLVGDQQPSLGAQFNAYHAPQPPQAPAPPAGSVMVTPLAWPFAEIAPAPMQVGGTYAFSFTPNSDPQGHSLSIAEFEAPPRMRSWCVAVDPHGVNRVAQGDGQGISGLVAFGTQQGQCQIQIGVTYYFIVTCGVGTPGDNATAVVVIR